MSKVQAVKLQEKRYLVEIPLTDIADYLLSSSGLRKNKLATASLIKENDVVSRNPKVVKLKPSVLKSEAFKRIVEDYKVHLSKYKIHLIVPDSKLEITGGEE